MFAVSIVHLNTFLGGSLPCCVCYCDSYFTLEIKLMCAKKKKKRAEQSVEMAFNDMISYKPIFESALRYRATQSFFSFSFLFLRYSYVISRSLSDGWL